MSLSNYFWNAFLLFECFTFASLQLASKSRTWSGFNRFPCSSSWVIQKIINSLRLASINLSNCSILTGSNDAVGSSSKTTLGLKDIPNASMILCCSPPESVDHCSYNSLFGMPSSLQTCTTYSNSSTNWTLRIFYHIRWSSRQLGAFLRNVQNSLSPFTTSHRVKVTVKQA